MAQGKKKLKMKPHTGKDVLNAMDKARKKVMNMKSYREVPEEMLRLKPYTPKDVVVNTNKAITKLNKKLGTNIPLLKPQAKS